jgi:hypothetical protein
MRDIFSAVLLSLIGAALVVVGVWRYLYLACCALQGTSLDLMDHSYLWNEWLVAWLGVYITAGAWVAFYISVRIVQERDQMRRWAAEERWRGDQMLIASRGWIRPKAIRP